MSLLEVVHDPTVWGWNLSPISKHMLSPGSYIRSLAPPRTQNFHGFRLCVFWWCVLKCPF